MKKEDYILFLEKIINLSKNEFNQYNIRTSEYKEKKRSTGEILGYGVYIYISSSASFMKVKIFPFFTISENKIFSIDVEFIIHKSTRVFSLKDYTAYRNIPFDSSHTINWLDKYEDSIDISLQFFKKLQKILDLEEMQKLLNTDYKIDVPIDYSPYK